MMQCTECNSSDAQPVRVVLSEDHVDDVPLCDECLNEFRNGDLVSDVIPLGTPESVETAENSAGDTQ